MKRWMVLVAGVLILVANLWAIVAVRLNRSQPTAGTVRLTERELRLPRAFGESTVLFLEIDWNTLHLPSEGRGMAEWLDAGKLAELGLSPEPVRASAQSADTGPRQSVVQAFVVLEYEGEAWRQAPPDKRRTTRFFAVDAGLDPQRLRATYPDRGRYVITRGLIRRIVRGERSPEARGMIETLIPSQVFVPRPYSQVLEALRPDDSTPHDPSMEPRFTAAVSWGRHYEPWVTEVSR